MYERIRASGEDQGTILFCGRLVSDLNKLLVVVSLSGQSKGLCGMLKVRASKLEVALLVWLVMMADAFSMFDYGGSGALVRCVCWFFRFVLPCELGLLGDIWVLGCRLNVVSSRVIKVINRLIGKGGALFGFRLFLLSLLIYLVRIGISGVFPYGFRPTCHFSHNFGVSLVVWFGVVGTRLCVRCKGVLAGLVPGGLPW